MSENAGKPQDRIINERKRSLLVAAGAGSGKTTVLVGRLMGYILNDGKNIDDFVVITFTKAAAAELRSRISEKISKAVSEERKSPNSDRMNHLRRQSALLGKAHIGTIHSFCTSILREYGGTLGLRPGFRVVEEERASVMKAAALDRVLEEHYSHPESYPGFLALADTVGHGRDDGRMSELILRTYNRLQSHPDPAGWMEIQEAELDREWAGVSDTEWGKDLLNEIRKDAEHFARRWEELVQETAGAEKDIARNINLFNQYAGWYEKLGSALNPAAGGGWNAVAACFPPEFDRKKTMNKAQDVEFVGRIESLIEISKKNISKLAEVFTSNEEDMLSNLKQTVPAMKALLETVAALGDEYATAKRELSLVDFSDLEHMTARLLIGPDGRITDVARTVSQRFTEIMVDEYQDVSRVQDAIFRAVSLDGNNLFLVGDMKQAIYRFRLADPQIFMEKYEAWSGNGDAGGKEPIVIPLIRNYRSRETIINAANAVFENAMTKRLGGIDYKKESQQLIYGSDKYQGDAPRPELIVIGAPSGSGAEDAETPGKSEVEAGVIADRIQELISRGDMVNDEDGVPHPVTWSDIAVLLRSLKNTEAVYRRVFAARGIPVSSGAEAGFFESPEIAQLSAMLSIVDNPRKDIPLLTVLRAPHFGFTPDELAEIRATDKESDLYSALCAAAENSARCSGFLDWLEETRQTAADLTVSELVWKLICDTDLLAVCAASSDGEARRTRILKFVELVQKQEGTGYRGLHHFLNWLQNLADSGHAPALETTGENGITITSIHKSKGLQYPVVFLADTAHGFNEQDARESVLVHPELGLGPDFVDLDRRIKFPTAAKNAIARRMVRESRSEEMRLLYVAMTRAKEQLYMTGMVNDIQKFTENVGKAVTHGGTDEVQLMEKNNMLFWIAAAALSERNSISFQSYSADRYNGYVREKETRGGNLPPEEEISACREKLERSLSCRYPHPAAVELPSKITATSIKGREEEQDEETWNMSPERKISPFSFRLPDFQSTEKAVTGAEKGTATHLVLQHINLSQTDSEEDIRQETARLVREQFLTEREAQAVDTAAVLGFYQSETGHRVKASQTLHREFRFSLLCPAERFLNTVCKDELLLQGVVDCCFEEEDGLVIVDYKTDAVRTEEEIAARAELYRPQMNAYIYALERIFSKPVKDCVLFFLASGREVHVLG